VVSLDIHHTSLSMNGEIINGISPPPFVLSLSKDSENVFQQPAKLGPQQNFARTRTAGMGNGFDTFAQRVNLLNQRRHRNAPFSQRI
jgi:hypothetical protein